MNENPGKFQGKIQINDLIAGAVYNAEARRNQALDSDELLPTLSDEQAGGVTGGAGGASLSVATAGMLPPFVLSGYIEKPKSILK
ncbi:hypothetical protein [Kamptonema formosum]|uniref:hypothetical protein n=1 Tax=Kamptonema formosum TaxID=331992 RepID=UPI00034B9F04|nr:hypothetical protein [Oscillatoria sp. PCC 10802]